MDAVDKELDRAAFLMLKNTQEAIYYHSTHPEEFPPRFSLRKRGINPKYGDGGGSLNNDDYEPDYMINLPVDRWRYSFNNKEVCIRYDGKDAVNGLISEYEDAWDSWATKYWSSVHNVPERHKKQIIERV